MNPRSGLVVLTVLIGTVCEFLAAGGGGPAWALGPSAPPIIRYANVEVFTSCPSCSPYLRPSLTVEVPGGNVPLHIQSVTVTVPGWGTYNMPFNNPDLYSWTDYENNLTGMGVTGFPAGTYTFTVTDTAGGVTTATDDLGTTTGLPATASVSITGIVPVNASAGVVNLLDLGGNPTPTVSWAAVAGALTHRVRVRPADNSVDLFSRYVGTATSVMLPAGIFTPGRRYMVRVDSYDHANGSGCSTPPGGTCQDSNARSRNLIYVYVPGPEVYLNFPSTTYAAGNTLNVGARIYNTGFPVTVNAEAWIGIPSGGVLSILEARDLVIPASWSGDFYNGIIFSYLFSGGEPAGTYVVGLRLVDKVTGETIAVNTRTFWK
jgi:hypothetical protein